MKAPPNRPVANRVKDAGSGITALASLRVPSAMRPDQLGLFRFRAPAKLRYRACASGKSAAYESMSMKDSASTMRASPAKIIRAAKPFLPAARKPGEATVLLLEPAQPLLEIPGREQHVATVVDSQTAFEPFR
jgi:hypothetical protein